MNNYGPYSSYYAKVLDCIDILYPGVYSALYTNGLSVQRQENYPLRTAIDNESRTNDKERCQN